MEDIEFKIGPENDEQQKAFDNNIGRSGSVKIKNNKSNKNRCVFVFDLDNTLVKTNRANNNAYKEAIRTIIGKEISIGYDRFTRSILSKVLPDLTTIQFDTIIKLKEDFYVNYLRETTLNKQLLKILKLAKESGCETILLTDSRKTRAKQVCDFHYLTPFFSRRYYKEDYGNVNKYQFLKSILPSSESVILFENAKKEIERALQHGLNENQIITIKF